MSIIDRAKSLKSDWRSNVDRTIVVMVTDQELEYLRTICSERKCTAEKAVRLCIDSMISPEDETDGS